MTRESAPAERIPLWIAGAALLAALFLVVLARGPAPSITVPSQEHGTGATADPDYARLPLAFEPNTGRTDPGVDFIARSGAGSAYLTGSGARLTLAEGKRAESVDLRLVGAEPSEPAAHGRLPGQVNDLRSDDATQWKTQIPTYQRVRYPGVYPGVDLDWHGTQERLEYDFHLAPGAAPDRIALRVGGADHVRLARDGDLLITSGGEILRQAAPVAYQRTASGRSEVPARFELHGEAVSFVLGAYDQRRPLVIDPVVLDYSTYLGGNGADQANAIAVDSSGAAYLTGRTLSTDFDTAGPVETDSTETNRHAADGDVFVTKLNPAGDAVVFSTYLGGDGDDTGNGIAVDQTGTYVAGTTESTDFNRVNAPAGEAFKNKDQGIADAFVAKLNPTGDGLVYSTPFGGGGHFSGGLSNSSASPGNAFEKKAGAADVGVAIAIDGAGSAYVVGNTNANTDISLGFPLRGQIEGDTPERQGTFDYPSSMVTDAFVTKFTAAGNDLVYSTFLGGNLGDGATAVAVDSAGSAYVAGATNSSDFTPGGGLEGYNGVDPGGVNKGNNSTFDAFISKLTPAGNALEYSTYLGGSDHDAAHAIAIDPAGAAYVTGTTQSPDFNQVNGIEGEGDSPGADAFAAKLNPAGNSLEYSSYLGGSDADQGNGIAVDPSGRAVLSGMTASKDFDRAGELEGDSGSDDAFVTSLSPSGALSCSTYLGGDGADAGNAIALDSDGAAYVAGSTKSNDFDTAGPVEGDSADAAADAFASKLRLTEPCEAHPASTAASQRDDLQVFTIVLDGLRPEEINPGYTPQLNELKQAGTWYAQARSVFLAETLPNHAAMMTGVMPDRSGLLGNDYWERNPENDDDSPNGSYDPSGANHRMLDPTKLDVETLPTTLEESCDVSTAVVQSKGYLWYLFGGEVPNPDDPNFQRRPDYLWGAPQSNAYIRDPDDHTPDAAVMSDGFMPWLEQEPPGPRFAFLNLGDIDRAGHIDESGVGAGVSAFRQSALADTDAQIRLLVDALKENGTWDDTVLIFTSDHGMDWSTADHSTGGETSPVPSEIETDTVANMDGVARVVSGGGTTMFYLQPGTDPGPIADKLSEVEGIETVATRAPLTGYPTLDDLGMDHRDTGDIVGLNKPGWRDGGWHSSTGNPLPGNHGHAVTQHSTLFVSGGHPALADPPPGAGPLGGGRAIDGPTVYDPDNPDPAKRVFFRRPDGGPGNLSVAPTVAKLFGLEPPEGGYDGQPLDAAFEEWAFTPHVPCRAANEPPSISIDDASLSEGNTGQRNATLTVSLSAPSVSEIRVDYRTNDASATAPADYEARGPTTLSFDPGETEKQITVPVKGDTADEPNETFTVDLSALENAEPAKLSGTATILDDDGPPDTDGDLVPDGADSCPTQAGPAVSSGCPQTPAATGAPESCRTETLGTAANDTLTGTTGPDLFRGLLGADRLSGLDGPDCLFGGPGNDTLSGEGGDDLLRGGNGRDVVLGGSEADVISGGRGPDRISGGAGDDQIRAADSGRDRVRCGPGLDEVIANPDDRVAASCEVVGRAD